MPKPNQATSGSATFRNEPQRSLDSFKGAPKRKETAAEKKKRKDREKLKQTVFSRRG